MPRANPDVNYEISIHALLAESDPFTTSMSTRLVGFLSTLSLRRATYAPLTSELHCLFLSTLSLRRATSFTGVSWSQPSNFYPRSPCGERLHIGRGCVMIHRISIHALLAESDPPAAASIPFCATFLSTLSLRRATAKSSIAAVPRALFLSTLSLRRATFRTPRRSKWGTHFYPRSPCGERRLLQNGFLDVAAISIHALLAESDARLAAFAQHGAEDFYPRSPCGERRYSLRPPPARGEISIHALLAESDHARVGVAAGAVISIHALLAESDREPTPTRWPQKISIHALLAESDAVSLSPQSRTYRFLSTLSLRRATSCFAWNCAKCRYFYPRSPCGERLGQGRDLFLVHFISIHALLAESDPTPRRTLPARSRFLSTLSLRRATDNDREKALNIALCLSTLSWRRAT